MKHKIQTKNREVYEKLNMLNFSDKVIMENVTNQMMNKIIKKVNAKDNNICLERVGNYVIIKKSRPINLDVYLMK